MAVRVVTIEQPGSFAATVAQPQYYVIIETSASIISTGTAIEKLGSDFTGAEGPNRTYTHSGSLSTNSKVYIGSDRGMVRLKSNQWSLSTTTVTNDTITILMDVLNTDSVVIDT